MRKYKTFTDEQHIRRGRHLEVFGAWMFAVGMFFGMWVAGFLHWIGVFQ